LAGTKTIYLNIDTYSGSVLFLVLHPYHKKGGATPRARCGGLAPDRVCVRCVEQGDGDGVWDEGVTMETDIKGEAMVLGMKRARVETGMQRALVETGIQRGRRWCRGSGVRGGDGDQDRATAPSAATVCEREKRERGAR
jgi:hypothetical protein